MNYDTLSDTRKDFIESLKFLDKPLCIELSDLLIEAESWQAFRILVFSYLDSRMDELDVIRGQLVRL